MSFRKFIRTKLRENKKFMAQISDAQMSSPTTEPMATLVSMMPSGGMRIAAMEWLLTDGLLAASMGRDKLLKEVLANMPMGGRDTVPIGVKAPVRPSSNVAGAGNVNLDFNFEAQELNYKLPDGPDEITAGALFSPIAREKIFPALNQVEIDGMNIDEYYHEKYEPKTMRLHVAGNWYNVDLEDVRKQISDMGLPVFTYGGPEGYIQHVEKGDYKPDHKRRAILDPLQHHGPSLTDGKVDDHKGKTVVSFTGGAKSYGSRDYEGVLNTMMKKFNSEFEGGNLSPELQQFTSKFADEIERIEREVDGAKKSPALALGVPGRKGRGAHPGVQNGIFQAQPEFSSHITAMLKKGVAEPFVSNSTGIFKNPEALKSFEEIDGKTHFTLSPTQQQEMLNFLLIDPENGSFGITKKLYTFLKDAGYTGSKHTPINIEEILKKGLDATPELKKSLRHVSHKFSGLDPKSFIKKSEVEFIPFDSYNLEKFQSNGYDFQLGQNKEMDDPIPEKTSFLGYMVNGPEKYRVVKGTDGGLHVELPIELDKTGTPKGKTGAILHSGGITVPGNRKLGHVGANPAPNEQEYKRLMDLLMQGELGEPGGPYNNEIELPSVKQGIVQGKSFLVTKVPKEVIEDNKEEMYSWAVQALWGFAGDSAFQFGHVSPEEIKDHLKNFENEVEKEENPRFKVKIMGGPRDGVAIDASSKEEVEQKIKQQFGDDAKIISMNQITGRDIHSKLHQQGAELDPPRYGTEEERTNVISDLGQIIKNLHKGAVPQSTDPEGENYIPLEAMKAFGDNAFEARKRYIAQHIKSMVWKKHKAERGRLEKSGQDTPSDGESGGTNFEDKGRSDFGDDAGFTAHVGDNKRLGQSRHKGVWDELGVNIPDRPTSRTTDDYDTSGASQGLQGQPQPQPQPQASQPSPQASDEFGDSGDQADMWLKKKLGQQPQKPQQPQQPQQPQKPNYRLDLFDESWDRNVFDRFQSFDQWKETSVVYDPKVPVEDGCGFNVWGAAPTSDPLGVSIKGDADTSKSDPTGKGKNVRRRKKK